MTSEASARLTDVLIHGLADPALNEPYKGDSITYMFELPEWLEREYLKRVDLWDGTCHLTAVDLENVEYRVVLSAAELNVDGRAAKVMILDALAAAIVFT